MNYFNFQMIDKDLALFSAIKEEDEGELESRRELSVVNTRTELKS
jgi:hypothetical protein